jgi:FMN phosphatase YigB (HAD superfamily)
VVVLLDLYDTLALIDRGVVAAGRGRLAERAGVDPDCLLRAWAASGEARSRGLMGAPREELRRLLAGCSDAPPGDDLLADLVRLEADGWRRGVRLFDDVPPALEGLRRAGHRLAIVSNCSWQAGEVLAATGLDRAVELAVLSFEVGAMKPEPAILRLALERLGAVPGDAVLVDDLTANLDAARALGMDALLMDRGRTAASTGHRAVGDLAAVAALLNVRRDGERGAGGPAPPRTGR